MQTSSGNLLQVSLGLLLVAAVAIGNAQAAGGAGYRTGTMVASDQGECAGVPSCLSSTLPAVVVPANDRASVRYICPPSHPNLWGWDAAQHESIHVKLVAIDQWTVTIEGMNLADTVGEFAVSLGCSTEPYAGTVVQQSRQLAPTTRLPERRPSVATMPGMGSRSTLAAASAGGSACEGVPECQPQPQARFTMKGWATTTKSYNCKAPYPYAWQIGYTQTGSPSVSAIPEISGSAPGTINILLTNWNPFQTDRVDITVGCSKHNVFGGTCGAPVSDPGCPVVSGTEHNYCSSGPVPVCFQTYQERCTPSKQLYSCTIDLLLIYCVPCPG